MYKEYNAIEIWMFKTLNIFKYKIFLKSSKHKRRLIHLEKKMLRIFIFINIFISFYIQSEKLSIPSKTSN